MGAKQTPLIDLLESVPADARLVHEHDQFNSESIPVGRLCREAATALRAALAEPDEVAAAVEAERAAILAACDRLCKACGGYQVPPELMRLMNWIRARSKP